MSDFLGQYTNSIDEKGRVSFPAKFRRAVNPEAEDTFVITSGFDHCLFVYPLDEWERKSATLREQPITDSETRKWRRVLAAFASETTCDKQGRIKIPQNLIEWAYLEKEALITGALDRVEIWNPDIFARYTGDIEDKFEELAEGLLF